MSEFSLEPSWSLGGLFSPNSPTIVRVICFFCLAMGVILSAPFIFLIILDICIWIWRTCWNRKPTANPPCALSHSAPPTPTLTTAKANDHHGSYKRHERS